MANIIVKGKKKKVKRNLNLSKMGITDISEIEGLESLTFLKGLNLKKNYITEIKGLDFLTNLKDLDLSENQITEIKGLENLRNLFALNLSSNNISEIKGLDNFKGLIILNLSSNNISEIKGLENLTKLVELHLDNNSFTDIKGLENLTNLITIKLGVFRDRKGFNLNGKIIPKKIAKKMGIRYSPGDKISRSFIYIRKKKMIKYCQFVKDTGNADFTTPGLLDLYDEWEYLH
ncbi:MAG: leucine-rich repeat domain-containing protein [Promethearchaeota archaeon]